MEQLDEVAGKEFKYGTRLADVVEEVEEEVVETDAT